MVIWVPGGPLVGLKPVMVGAGGCVGAASS